MKSIQLKDSGLNKEKYIVTCKNYTSDRTATRAFRCHADVWIRILSIWIWIDNDRKIRIIYISHN